MKITQPLKYTLVAITAALLMLSMTVFAAPFMPGETLDPGCNPDTLDCYVQGDNIYSADGTILGSRLVDGGDLIIQNANTPFQFKTGYQTQFSDILSLDLPFVGMELFDDVRSAVMINGIVDFTPFSGLVGGSNNYESTLATFDLANDAIHNILTNTGGNTIASRDSDLEDRWALTTNVGSILMRGASGTTGESAQAEIDDTYTYTIRVDDGGGIIRETRFALDDVTIGEYSIPYTDGSANQVLQTDGAGSVSWQNSATGNLPAYADDITAGGAGLLAGEYYQTDGSGVAPLNVAGIVMIKQ